MLTQPTQQAKQPRLRHPRRDHGHPGRHRHSARHRPGQCPTRQHAQPHQGHTHPTRQGIRQSPQAHLPQLRPANKGRSPQHRPGTTPHPSDPHTSGGSTVSGTVTQIDDSLHDTLGPPPTFDDPPHFTEDNDSLKSELVSYTQEYIHTVTDDGNTLVTVLTGILYADPDDETVSACHRVDAAQILLDRALGVDCDPPEDPADEIPPEDIRTAPRSGWKRASAS